MLDTMVDTKIRESLAENFDSRAGPSVLFHCLFAIILKQRQVYMDRKWGHERILLLKASLDCCTRSGHEIYLERESSHFFFFFYLFPYFHISLLCTFLLSEVG